MIQTRTPEQIAARKARVAQMTAEGRVMTSALRTRIANQQRKAQKLQDAADAVIAGLNASQIASNRYSGISTAEVIVNVAPEATTNLSRHQKEDTLAVKASKVIQELLNS
jgi:hypothetical protein